MKISNLFLLMAAVFALASCGTYTQSAQRGGAQFRNSIYYNPDNSQSEEYMQQQQYLAQLQQKTGETLQGEQTSYDRADNTVTVQVGESNVVDIEYNPSVTYRIVDDPESYEARLRKFDSPTYTINIEMGTYPSLSYYSWYRPSWRWYYSWHNPWYRWDSYWYSALNYPWYGAWYSPWYADFAWGYYNPFYDPFYNPWWAHHYGPGFYPGYYPIHRPGHGHPGYHPGHGPGAPSHGKDVYYGKRNESPSYKNVRKGNSGSMASGPAAGKPTTGSVTRRPQSSSQNKGQGAVKSSGNKHTNTSTVTNRNNNSNSNRGSYTRTTTQQTRSNNSSYQNSGYSGGRSSGTTGNNGGGSSYRRR